MCRNDSRLEVRRELNATIGDGTTNYGFRKSIATFNQLRAQFSQLVQFFSNISNLITNVMTPSVERLVDTLGAAKDMVLGGVGLKAFTKNMIYRTSRCSLLRSVLTILHRTYVGPFKIALGI